jgi:hypothetical protein
MVTPPLRDVLTITKKRGICDRPVAGVVARAPELR